MDHFGSTLSSNVSGFAAAETRTTFAASTAFTFVLALVFAFAFALVFATVADRRAARATLECCVTFFAALPTLNVRFRLIFSKTFQTQRAYIHGLIDVLSSKSHNASDLLQLTSKDLPSVQTLCVQYQMTPDCAVVQVVDDDANFQVICQGCACVLAILHARTLKRFNSAQYITTEVPPPEL